MLLELVLIAAVLYFVMRPRTLYVDTVPERYTPYKMSSEHDLAPNAYNTQRYYKNNPNIYPVFWNYDKALAFQKKKEYLYLQNERTAVRTAYNK